MFHFEFRVSNFTLSFKFHFEFRVLSFASSFEFCYEFWVLLWVLSFTSSFEFCFEFRVSLWASSFKFCFEFQVWHLITMVKFAIHSLIFQKRSHRYLYRHQWMKAIVSKSIGISPTVLNFENNPNVAIIKIMRKTAVYVTSI